MFNPVVIIPARKGSKGVPGKNTKHLGGKALIAYTIETALELFRKDQICITTDDDNVIEIAQFYGLHVPFKRPAELAVDNASMDDVIRHALSNFTKNNNFNIVVLLQPTSPLRRSTHIKEALDLFSCQDDMVVSVKETKSNPYYLLFEENDFGYLEKSKKGAFKTRQECPKVWEYNGAIYVINAKSLKNNCLNGFNRVKKYVMNELDSIDIDTPYDWELAETIIKKLNKIE